MNQKPVILTEDKAINISYSKENEGGTQTFSYATQYILIFEEIIKQLKKEPSSISFTFKEESDESNSF
jgi:hypothetical protein